MIEVELPDGSVVEFPDGTDNSTMEKALQDFGVKSEAASRLKEMSLPRKALFGVEKALHEQGAGLAQLGLGLVGKDIPESTKREVAVRRQMAKDIPGLPTAEILTNVATLGVPAAGIQQGLLKMFPKVAARFLPQLGAAGVAGGATGAIPAVIGDESRAENIQQGAALGALGYAGGQAIGRGIEGVIKLSDAAKRLPQRVQDAATLGQVANRDTGGGRLAAALEERMTSLPIIGSSIKSARERAIDEWRNDILEQASPKGFVASDVPGRTFRERVGETYDEFSSRYGKALAGHKLSPSQQFERMVLRMTTDPQRGIPEDVAQRIQKQVMTNYQSRFAGVPQQAPAGANVIPLGGQRGTVPEMTGRNAKDFESFLSDMSRQYAKGQNPMDPNIGRLYGDLERAWEAAYKRQLGSGFRKSISELDAQYAPYKTVERAAASVGNEGGAFTPAQLVNAVSSRTGRERFGRGAGILADEATTGKSVFMDRLPNSGTGDRLMTGSAITSLAIDPLSTTATGLGVGAASKLFTSKAGKNLMTGNTRLQKLLQQMQMQRAARELGLPGGVVSNQFMNEEPTEY